MNRIFLKLAARFESFTSVQNVQSLSWNPEEDVPNGIFGSMDDTEWQSHVCRNMYQQAGQSVDMVDHRDMERIGMCRPSSSFFQVIAATKVGAVEVFGYKPQETINSRQLHDSFPLHQQSTPQIDHTLTHAAYSSPPPNITMVQSSPKQFTDAPLPTMPTDITVSHPIVSDANARIPLYVYNPGLARKLGLSTLLMTSVIYGLSILPALFAATGSNPLGGLISSIGRKRKRRSYWPRNFWEMPLMNKEMTEKFLTLLETTMEVRKVNSSLCKQHHLCRVYQTALVEEDYLDESGKETEKISPNLSVFEKAVINMFGIAAERKDYHLNLGQAVKFYFESALVGITGSNCSKIFPCAEEIKYSQATKRIV